MGETNSVAFNFERVGLIKYPPMVGDEDKIMEAAIEAGAQDLDSSEVGHDVYCEPDDLHDVQKFLEEALGEPDSARLDWRPLNTVGVSESDAKTLFGLLSALDDSDDVQHVAANFDVDDDVISSFGD